MKLLTDQETCLKLGWEPIMGLTEKSYVNGPSNQRIRWWEKPDSDRVVGTPKFNTSLDAQRDYLWPWLYEKKHSVVLANNRHGTSARILTKEFSLISVSQHENPATAFMMALSDWWSNYEK